METLEHGLFWQVNERVVAFDWVDPDLRVQIPRLRQALRGRTRRHGAGKAPTGTTAGPEDLVQPVKLG
jgi:hypothetical protein